MANTIHDFEKINIEGESFSRILIPGYLFVQILRGDYLGMSDWGFFERIIDGIPTVYFPNNFVVTDDVKLQSNYFFENNIYIDGGFFKGKLIFNGTFNNIEINNGVFNDLIIENGVYNSFKIRNGFFKLFQIENGIFEGNTTISGGKFQQCIINGGVFKSDYILSGGEYRDYLITNGDFQDTYIITGGQFEMNYDLLGGQFNNYTIKDGLFTFYSLSGGEFNNYHIFNGKFLSAFLVSEVHIKRFFIVNGGVYENTFSFSSGKIFYLSINFGEFNRKVFFNEILINMLEITTKVVFHDYVQFDETKIKQMVGINNMSDNIFLFKNLYIKDLSNIKVNNLSIGAGTYINTLNFTNTIVEKQSVWSFENTIVNVLVFDKFYNYGSLNFNEITMSNDTFFWHLGGNDFKLLEGGTKSEIKISNSDLGKVQFINCKLETTNFHFQSSKITDMFLAGTSFPSAINNNDFSQRRLGYGQLKKVYENRGDLIEARKYYAKEMIAYWRTIKPTQIGEHILLFLNFISNGFSRYWLVGFTFTIIITHIFFGLYALSLGYWFQFDDVGWQNYYKIFKFFSIVSDIDLLPGNPSFWTYLSSLIGRLFIAFGIYQTIAAFRKHGRSGG